MRRTLLALSLFALADGATSSAEDEALPATFRDVFEHAESVELVSIDPAVHRPFGYGPRAADPEPLARWLVALREADGVYGRVAVAGAEVRGAILHALAEGVAHPGPPAGCYDPRHALVARRGDATVVVHLCFACNSAVFLDAATTAGRTTGFQDQEGLLARLDGLLRDAKVPLARDVEAAAAKAGPKGPQLSAPFELFGLSEPETLDVYGLDPAVYAGFGEGTLPGPGTPYAQAMAALTEGRGVRSKATITRASARKALSDAVYRGYAQGGDPAKCFLPRHALVMGAGPKKVVVFLCFECSYATAIGEKTEGGRNLLAFSDPGHLRARLDLILAAAPPPAAAQPPGPTKAPSK